MAASSGEALLDEPGEGEFVGIEKFEWHSDRPIVGPGLKLFRRIDEKDYRVVNIVVKPLGDFKRNREISQRFISTDSGTITEGD